VGAAGLVLAVGGGAIASARVEPAAAAVSAAPAMVRAAPSRTSANPAFTIAVIPDTQAETARADRRFDHRTRWLVRAADALDLRYVLHTGDITNWGWLDQAQYVKARSAMGRLTAAGIPYSVAAGNHDGRAVGWDGVAGSTGYGGSAYMYNPECPARLGAALCWSWILNRMTAEFNQYFDESTYGGLAGEFERGKTENSYSYFTAEGKSFLVLTLELWPRREVIAWANRVVAANPHRTVLVQTHSYLTASGAISTSNGGYGATSPQFLFDHLIKRHRNIAMVFSGHTGRGAKRTDRGVHGNTIVSYLFNDAGPRRNPVRLVRINTATGRVVSRVISPASSERMPEYRTADTVSLVR
jgi:hypothetical protein